MRSLMKVLMLFSISLCLIAVFVFILFWRLGSADKRILRLRLDLDHMKRRMGSLERQVGWDGDRAFTVAFNKDRTQ